MPPAGFLDRLPGLQRDLMGEWQLSVDGEPTHGNTAVVLPVRTSSGRPAVLKVGWPHEEAEHEHLALQHWHGRGAVQLLRADPHRFALLLERLHREDLGDLWDVEACEVVGGLDGLPRDAPVPRRLVQQAASLGRDLSRDEASSGRMIHTDLHYANVLAADREPWLAIDPKPLSGDPHYEVAPLLWNRWDELAGDIRRGVRRRFHAAIDAA